jgi:NADH-quinone oxidoreductase subunit H
MRFAMFFLGEYINMFGVSALATTLFLGGCQAPPFIASIGGGVFNQGWWGLLWFTVKVWLFMFLFVWLRGSLPRTRYDQFMRFGWKRLIPITILWVVYVVFDKAARAGWLGDSTFSFTLFGNTRTLYLAQVLLIAVMVLLLLWALLRFDSRARQPQAITHVPEEIDPFAGGYPVPPLPGQRLREPERGIPAVGASTVVAKEDVHG